MNEKIGDENFDRGNNPAEVPPGTMAGLIGNVRTKTFQELNKSAMKISLETNEYKNNGLINHLINPSWYTLRRIAYGRNFMMCASDTWDTISLATSCGG